MAAYVYTFDGVKLLLSATISSGSLSTLKTS